MNSIINKEVSFVDLGLIDYKDAWDYQEELFKSKVNTKINNRHLEDEDQIPVTNHLIFCEHPPVYTLGKSGDQNNLLVSEDQLGREQATYYKINRGGDITFHGPGQLVGYPILDLENFFTDIHKYLRFLEESIIRTLGDFGIIAGRIKGLTGVWVDHLQEEPLDGHTWNPRKICAFGVKTSRWVTMHGFALNVNTDLSYFNNIVPCGIDDKAVTSIQQEVGEISMLDVKNNLKGHLEEVFEMELSS